MAPKDSQPNGRQDAVQRPAAPIAVPAAAPAASPAPAATPSAAPQPLAGTALVLPLGVVSRSDLSRSLRELGVLDDYFRQASIRGAKADAVPTISKTLDALAAANKLNLIHAEHRAALKEFLTKLKASAPVIHISFPSAASAPFIAKVLEWFRAKVHPHVVLHIGLQPELAAGCTVRTTNKMFDLSLRKRFEQSKQKLLKSISELDKAADRTPVADANATVSQEARL